MDPKRNQRILGIAVIIALAVIVFPLLFSKNSQTVAPTQVASIDPPPFPDQATPAPVSPSEETIVNAPQPNAVPEKSAAIEQSQLHQTPITKSLQSVAPLENHPSSALNDSEGANILQLNAAPSDRPSVKPVTKAHHEKAKANVLTEKDLLKLRSTAWVVQMGSFRDKANASRLADKLRAAGYQAFTREVKAKHGSQMRVYVGPEFKQLAALKLSSQIAHETKMQGIVVLYQPLAL